MIEFFKAISAKNKKLTIIGIIVIFIFFARYEYIYCSHFVNFTGDDVWYTFLLPWQNIRDYLFCDEHGYKYIGFYLNRFINFYIPSYLGIHPSDFIASYSLVIKSFFTLLILLTFESFVFLPIKERKQEINNLLILFFFSVLTLLFTYYFSIYFFGALFNVCFYNFYRYVLSNIFLLSIFYYFSKQLLDNNYKANKYINIYIILCGYIVATSIEIAPVIAMTFLTGTLLLKAIIYKKFSLTNIFTIISLITGGIVVISSFGFQDISRTRGISAGHFATNNWLELFHEFIPEYINFCFDCIVAKILFVLFICAVIITAFTKDKNGIKLCGITCLMYFSILVGIFSLFFCGKTSEWDNHFFLVHTNIIPYYRILLTMPVLLLLGYIINKIINNNFSKYIKNSFIIFISITMLIGSYKLLDMTKSFLDGTKYEHSELRRNMYIVEKISRLSQLKKQKTIYVPQSMTEKWPELSYIEDGNNNARFFHVYLRRLYYDTYFDEVETLYVPDNIAFQKFKDLGGVFTSEELKNFKFQNLYNDDFVLNQQKNRITNIIIRFEFKDKIKTSVIKIEN